MARRAIPHDLAAEEALIGAMLLSRGAIQDAIALVTAEDFYAPICGQAFQAIADLHGDGRAVDPLTVAVELDSRGVGTEKTKSALLRIQAQTPASAHVAEYARIVVDEANRRGLLAVAASLSTLAVDPQAPPADTADRAKAALADLDRAGRVRRHAPFREWAETIADDHDWLVPAVLERRDRAILVAVEGAGKSTLLRQWGLMLACGTHWFTGASIRPATTLVFDIENSARQIVRSLKPSYDLAAAKTGWDEDRFTIVPFASLDLLRRSDRLAAESYLAGHRPDLLVVGPLYKMFRRQGGSRYEEEALAVTAVLDDWRDRFGVAVLIEHHAPKGSAGKRELVPAHSAVWLHWPEFGLCLEAVEGDPKRFTLGHYRGQREWRAWPDELHRGPVGDWPWKAPTTERF